MNRGEFDHRYHKYIIAMEEKREVTLYLSKDKNIPLIAATSGCTT